MIKSPMPSRRRGAAASHCGHVPLVFKRRLFVLTLLLTCGIFAATAAPAAGKPNYPARTPVTEGRWTNDAQKFQFSILGDRRGGEDTEWPVFDRAVDEINLLRPDFTIMVGDQIEGYTQDLNEVGSEWTDFRAHADRLQSPLFILPGNHDISNPDMLRWWQEHVGRTYYSFNYKGCHFLVLNTEECWTQNDSSIGPEQVNFALADLKRNKKARHTFVFLHKPLWTDDTNTEWKQIEAAFEGRPCTVFAGHTHRLTFEQRNGVRYVIVAATKGKVLNPPDDAPPQMGAFPHYTEVTVDGSDAYVTYIEPAGPMWPEDIAPRTFQDAARNLFQMQALPPEGLQDGRSKARTGFAVTVANALPGPVELTIEVLDAAPDGWQPVEGGYSRTIAAAPGSTQTFNVLFDVPAARLVPVPRLWCRASYEGKTVYRLERNLPLYPDTALREVPEWEVVGPFAAGSLPNALPDKPREALPQVFLKRGPEDGYRAGAAYTENGKSLAWQRFKTEAGFVNLARLCETPTEVLAYGLCGVYSPAAQTVYAEFRVDDYGQIFVNGKGIEDERLFRTRSDATYVALPLNAGWNSIVVKGVNRTGGWTFRLRLADPASELRFAPHPE